MLTTDKQSHHKNNFLVLLENKKRLSKKYIINALNESQALRIGINKALRLYPEENITRARVCDVYENESKKIVIKKTIA